MYRTVLVTPPRTVDKELSSGCLCESDNGQDTGGESTHCWLDVGSGTGEGSNSWLC